MEHAPMNRFRTCAKCGTPQQQWRMQGQEGVRGNNGKVYCSQGCAEAANSEHVNALMQETYLEDDIKGPSEEPMSMEHRGKCRMPPGQVGHGSGSTGGGTPVPRVRKPSH